MIINGDDFTIVFRENLVKPLFVQPVLFPIVDPNLGDEVAIHIQPPCDLLTVPCPSTFSRPLDGFILPKILDMLPSLTRVVTKYEEIQVLLVDGALIHEIFEVDQPTPVLLAKEDDGHGRHFFGLNITLPREQRPNPYITPDP